MTLREPGELDARREAWRRLAARRAHLMAGHAWIAAALETLDGSGGGRVLALLRGDRLLGALPLRSRPDGILVSLAGPETGEPTPLLYEDPARVGELVSAALQRSTGVELVRVTPYGKESEAVVRALGWRALVVQRSAGRSPYLPLIADHEEWFRSRPSRRRGDWARARRRAEGLGRVSFDFHRPDEASAGELLEVAIDVESRSWREEAGTTLASDERLGAFFRALAPRLARDGELVIATMSLDDRAVAMQIAAEYAGRYWLLKIGHDEEAGRCSPGVLLMLEAIARARSRGLHSFEFLGNDAPWIRQWTGRTRPMCSMSLVPTRSPAALWWTGRRLLGEAMERYGGRSGR